MVQQKAFNILILLLVSNILFGQPIPSERIIDWDPGISIDSTTDDGIPFYPVAVNVLDFGAKADGKTDDIAAITRAIEECPEYHAVLIPEGSYLISTPVKITKPIVLRGEVEPVTGLSRTHIYNKKEAVTAAAGYKLEAAKEILSGYDKNSQKIVVSDASGFSTGDYLLTDQLNDGDFVTDIGIGGASTWSSRENGTRCVGQTNRVVAVEGDTLILEIPLYHTYIDSLNPQVGKISGMLEHAGIEDLHVNGLYSSASTNVAFMGVAGCWIKNVHSENADRSHFSLWRSYKSEIIRNYLHHNRTGYASQSYGVEFFLQSTANLIENNIFFHLHSAMMVAGGLTGSVFAYNYNSEIKYVQPHTLGIDGGMHGGHPNMILFEGNVFYKAVCDSYWGSNAQIFFLRNHIRGHSKNTTTANIAVDIQAKCWDITVVGNVLGTPDFEGYYERVDVDAPYWNTWAIYKLGYNSFGDGDPADNDSTVLKTLIRYGNYDYVTKNIVWDADSAEIPNSMYLSTKPYFFEDEKWPPVDPLAGEGEMLSELPAKNRFDLILSSDTIAPSTEPKFELIKATGKTATFNWRFVEDNIGMGTYNIYRSGQLINSTIYEGPWTDKSLSPDHEYAYYFKAVDFAGNERPAPDTLYVKTSSAQKYRLLVNKGSGSGEYNEGESIVVSANDRTADGYNFIQWIGDTENLKSSWSAKTEVQVWGDTKLAASYQKVNGTDNSTPEKPSGFRAEARTQNSILLDWEIPDDDTGVYYFSLFYANGESIDSWIQECGYLDSNLKADSIYRYKLTATDRAGNTSQPVYLTVDVPELQENDTIPPTTPANLTALSITSTKVVLEWEESTDNTSGVQYIIFRDSIDVDTLLLTAFTDTGLVPGSIYAYYVVAFDSAGNLSNPSRILQIKTLDEPTSLRNQVSRNREVTIFPNPANRILNIRDAQMKMAILINIHGQVLGRTKQKKLDISALPAGQYILKVVSESGTKNYTVLIE